MRGDAKAVWNFSENSSVLEEVGFPTELTFFVLLIITVTQYNPNLQMIRGRTSLNYNGKFSSPAVTLGVFRSFSPVPPPSYSSQTLPLCLFQVFIIMMMGDNDEHGSDQGGTKRCSAVATLHENLSFGRKS